MVDDGKTGYLVKPMDSQAIASAAVSFFKDGIEKAFARNIALEQEQFSWIRMIETIEAFSKQ